MTTRRQYDGQFKRSAVHLLEESDLPLAQVARSLGVHESMLRRWRNQVRSRGSRAFAPNGRAGASALERLRRENRRLKRELAMVKKTLPLLARRSK